MPANGPDSPARAQGSGLRPVFIRLRMPFALSRRLRRRRFFFRVFLKLSPALVKIPNSILSPSGVRVSSVSSTTSGVHINGEMKSARRELNARRYG